MLSGNLRDKVLFYKKTGEANNPNYEFYKSIWAQKLYKSGASVIQSYQLLDTKSLTIKIRNRKDIDSSMRVKIDDEFFDIIHIQTVGGFNGDMILDIVLTI